MNIIYKSNRDNIEISGFLKIFKWYGVTQILTIKYKHGGIKSNINSIPILANNIGGIT